METLGQEQRVTSIFSKIAYLETEAAEDIDFEDALGYLALCKERNVYQPRTVNQVIKYVKELQKEHRRKQDGS